MEVGAASISGVRMAVHEEKTAASRSVAVVEGGNVRDFYLKATTRAESKRTRGIPLASNYKASSQRLYRRVRKLP